MKDRIVLAYSGALASSMAIPWLTETYGAEIIAATLDLGQGKELEEVRQRALAIGAIRAHVLDVREEFARDYILPALQSGAIDEGRNPMATSLGRALIAKKVIEVAEVENAAAIAHGCTAKGDDRARFDISARALNPAVRICAPACEWGMTGTEAIEYARQRNVPVPRTIDSPYRTASNLWGKSIECSLLENPWLEPPEDMYTLTTSPSASPDRPAYVEVAFDRGVPVGVNGVAMDLVELIESVATIAAGHGVGRIDMVENRFVGIKAREIHEAPAALVLHIAHAELESFVTARDLKRLKRELSVTYADLVHNGLWFTPMREAIDAFNAKVQEKVSGVIRLKLFKGACTVVGRSSRYALYDHGLATDDLADSHAPAAQAMTNDERSMTTDIRYSSDLQHSSFSIQHS